MTSVAIVGPTRSGKTAECAIPGVLDWVGPAILLSVKRDLLDTTIARRRQLEAYGRRADVLLTNHATKLFFPAASDDSTLGYQSKIVGDEAVERRSRSAEVGDGTGRRGRSPGRTSANRWCRTSWLG